MNKCIECLVKEGNTWYKEKQVVEEFSEVWMILVTVRDRRRIEKLLSFSCAPAVPRPRDSRTSRAEATTAAVVLPDQATSGLSFSVSAATSSADSRRSETLRDSFNEAAIYSSTSDLGLRGATAHRRRALRPLFMTALEKNSTLLLDVKHTRTQYDSLTTQGIYQRSRDGLSRK